MYIGYTVPVNVVTDPGNEFGEGHYLVPRNRII